MATRRGAHTAPRPIKGPQPDVSNFDRIITDALPNCEQTRLRNPVLFRVRGEYRGAPGLQVWC
jgi:hypothetical protein